MFESERVRQFVLLIFKHGAVTKKTQSLYGTHNYYLAIWNLRDAGMIVEDGVDESNQKVWRLTEKGLRLAKLFADLKLIDEKIDRLVGERFKL